MQVISQESYPTLRKSPRASLRPSKHSIFVATDKGHETIIISPREEGRKERKNYNDDNNHRTRIGRFKGSRGVSLSLSFARETDWSLAMKTSERLMVDFFPYHLPRDGSIRPTDKLFPIHPETSLNAVRFILFQSGESDRVKKQLNCAIVYAANEQGAPKSRHGQFLSADNLLFLQSPKCYCHSLQTYLCFTVTLALMAIVRTNINVPKLQFPRNARVK